MERWRPVLAEGESVPLKEVVLEGVGKTSSVHLAEGTCARGLVLDVNRVFPELDFCFSLLHNDTVLAPDSPVPDRVSVVPGSPSHLLCPCDFPATEKYHWRGTAVLFPESSGPRHRVMQKGVNFRSVCRNPICTARSEVFYSPRGFGTFSIEREMQIVKCPLCGERGDRADQMGFFEAKFNVEGMTRDESEYSIEHGRAEAGAYHAFLDKDRADWAFLMAVVEELTR